MLPILDNLFFSYRHLIMFTLHVLIFLVSLSIVPPPRDVACHHCIFASPVTLPPSFQGSMVLPLTVSPVFFTVMV